MAVTPRSGGTFHGKAGLTMHPQPVVGRGLRLTPVDHGTLAKGFKSARQNTPKFRYFYLKLNALLRMRNIVSEGLT